MLQAAYISIKDLLLIGMKGIPGIAITYHEDYAPEEGDEEMLLRGPKWIINPTISN
jgi:hypothetical protein